MHKRIAVYDTKAEDCAMTAAAVRACYERRGEDVTVAEFTLRERFILAFGDERYSMAFLGMNSVLDVDVARGIRVIDPKCPLFFVSDIPDYGIEAFRLGALDYLVKPITAERVGEVICRIGETMDEARQSTNITREGILMSEQAKRPFYAIEHRCNNRGDIGRAIIDRGANAVECDLRSEDGYNWYVDHDHCSGTTLDVFLGEAVWVTEQVGEKFALIYLDIKTPNFIWGLYSAIHRHHICNTNIKLLYSIEDHKNCGYFEQITPHLNEHEGCCIDSCDNPDEIEKLYRKLNFPRVWYSYGSTTAGDSKKYQNAFKRANHLSYWNDVIKKTCYWTVKEKKTIDRYTNEILIDSMMANNDGVNNDKGINYLIWKVNNSDKCKMATSSDDPFTVFKGQGEPK